MEQDIVLKNKIDLVSQKALSLDIVDDATMHIAVEVLSVLNQYNDKIVEEKEKVTKPLLQALKHERSRWKSLEDRIEAPIVSIRAKLSQYQTSLVNSHKEEQEAIVARIAPGKGNLSFSKAVEKIEALPQINKEIPTNSGLVQFRETKVLKITNIDLIPREFFDLNESSLLKNLKMGREIPGAELDTIQVAANYR